MTAKAETLHSSVARGWIGPTAKTVQVKFDCSDRLFRSSEQSVKSREGKRRERWETTGFQIGG